MIRSKKDYLDYLEADRLALGKKTKRPKLFGDEEWKFQRVMRAVEYHKNCGRSLFSRLVLAYLRHRFHRLSLLCGFSIPPNVFGPGLAIVHRGTIVINSRVRVGSGCRIHTCVNIGASGGDPDAVPVLGNDVYIAPGAKIYGRIKIADGIAIGANSVVNRSFDEPDITIAGIPAAKISAKGSREAARSFSQAA